jgi:two-component system, chemotaxis family, CheB/CheR fusion protein
LARSLGSDPEEVRALFQELLIGVTNFFRDPEAFAFLKQQVLAELVSRDESEPLRVWIPGCATGEEAYSVAILLQECLQERGAFRSLQIFGTDIDPTAVKKARQGAYVENIVSEVSPDRLRRFFVKEDSRYRVKPDIRERVVFSEQNILSDPPFAHLDLLVCRNLLIYLKPEAQSRMIPLFHYALREGGFLFLGSSESVGRLNDLFETVNKHHSIYRRKNHVLSRQVQFPTGRRLEGPAEQRVKEGLERPEAGVTRAVEKVLMAEHTPACVVVNQNGEIIHFHGRTGKYLEPALGAPRWHIGEMAREGLRFALLSALRRAKSEEVEVRERSVRVKTNGEYQPINLIVKNLKDPMVQGCQMVVFEDLPEPSLAEEGKEGPRPEGKDAEKMEELEQELMRVTQDYRGPSMPEWRSSRRSLCLYPGEMNGSCSWTMRKSWLSRSEICWSILGTRLRRLGTVKKP